MRRIFFDPPKPKIQKKKAIVKQNEKDFEKEIRTVLEVEGMPVFPGKISQLIQERNPGIDLTPSDLTPKLKELERSGKIRKI